MNSPSSESGAPWWRFRMMWLVVGGPALVVVASFVTLALAIHGRDIPLTESTAAAEDAAAAHTPAMQARNHAVAARR